jgi:hypothetical protein
LKRGKVNLTDVYNASVNYDIDVAQGVALPNVTLINPFYIGSYEGYFYVCLGCHNLINGFNTAV